MNTLFDFCASATQELRVAALEILRQLASEESLRLTMLRAGCHTAVAALLRSELRIDRCLALEVLDELASVALRPVVVSDASEAWNKIWNEMCEAQLEKLNGAANESYSEEIAENGEKVEDVEKDEVKESDCNIVEKAPNDYAHQESTISDLLFGKKDILSDQQKLAAENLAKEVEMMTNYNSGVPRYVLMQRPYYRLKASVDLFMERDDTGDCRASAFS